ncbi:MAG TPA: hypothetical protein VFA64_08440 [Hyphomicrobiaceae bacterium]|nr:hypothetical protein [Hyphomicrobiaceae bacterium]
MSQVSQWLDATIFDTAFNYRAGWYSALACCAVAYYVARQVREHAPLYTVLALFAAAWALVAAAIESRLLEPSRPTGLSDRAQDIASYLLVYSGAILAREDDRRPWLRHAQQWLQGAGLALLFLLVVRSQFASLPLSPAQVQLLGGEAMSQLGFLSIAVGSYAVAGRKAFGLMVAVLLVYIGAGVLRTIELGSLPPGSPRTFLPPALAYVFIAERFLLTGLYCYIVAAHARRLKDRR